MNTPHLNKLSPTAWSNQMTKLEMAHELLITLIQAGEHNNCSDTAVNYVWRVMDAMQAESDKRGTVQYTRSGHTVTTYERPAVLQDEWQPDWSVAPVWAKYWVKSRGCAYLWILNKPTMTEDYFASHGKAQIAPSFGYQGSWENSLRKRP